MPFSYAFAQRTNKFFKKNFGLFKQIYYLCTYICADNRKNEHIT